MLSRLGVGDMCIMDGEYLGGDVRATRARTGPGVVWDLSILCGAGELRCSYFPRELSEGLPDHRCRVHAVVADLTVFADRVQVRLSSLRFIDGTGDDDEDVP